MVDYQYGGICFMGDGSQVINQPTHGGVIALICSAAHGCNERVNDNQVIFLCVFVYLFYSRPVAALPIVKVGDSKQDIGVMGLPVNRHGPLLYAPVAIFKRVKQYLRFHRFPAQEIRAGIYALCQLQREPTLTAFRPPAQND